MTSSPAWGRFQVVQIAPHGSGGVSDYLEHLQAAWQGQGLSSEAWRLSEADVQARSLAQRLLALPGADDLGCVVVLHFSGYGYASRGLCGWLLEELQAARKLQGQRFKLVSVFHELYAKGPPWRSAFWTSPLQARLARRLARMSDAVWTNTEGHGRWLSRQARPWAGVHVAPVFSNVGEWLQPLAPAQDRSAAMVVFGGASTRQRACEACVGQGAQLAGLGVQELVEVGPGPACAWSLGALPVRHAGLLSTPELSALLASSRFGLVDYQGRNLGKSSVFAAYAAHGCCVINSSSEGEAADGLLAHHHYHPLHSAGTAPADLQAWARLGQEAHRWYAQHRLPLQAQRWLQLLAQVGHG